MKHLSIVIPAYNEEERIEKALQDYLSFYKDFSEKNNKTVEIIVVLNGCTDNTLKIVKEYSTKYKDILKIIDVKEAIGKGGAVYKGFSESSGELIGFVDADDATSAFEYHKLVENINNADGIIASRWLKESVVKNRPFYRKLSSKLFVSIVRAIFKVPYSDTQCGAKLFKKNKILPLLSKLKETSMVFDVEMLYVFFKEGLEIKEYATYWVDQPGSHVLGAPHRVFIKGINMIQSLLKIKKYGKKGNL